MRSLILMIVCLVPALPGCSQSEPPAQAAAPRLVVHKSPTCGCCVKWEVGIRSKGFQVESVITDDLSQLKAKNRVPAELASCHTAFVEGYVIEGHVPAHAIQRLLSERPAARGLGVPGMPAGSPGMAEPGQEGGYDVLLLREDGTTELFERVPAASGRSAARSVPASGTRAD
jgi:hypothetical protein